MLKGDVSQPCFEKIGPSKNGRHTSRAPAPDASFSIRIAAGYEYVLANSNQNSMGMSQREG
jgi:hypothetical protein